MMHELTKQLSRTFEVAGERLLDFECVYFVVARQRVRQCENVELAGTWQFDFKFSAARGCCDVATKRSNSGLNKLLILSLVP